MKLSILILSTLFTVSSYAQCMIKYERTACPGTHRSGQTNEAISYKKCGGQKTCVKEKPASSLAECQAAAAKSCANKRYSITKLKVITATWNGEAINDASGKADFCMNYAKRKEEFNRCR